MYIENQNKISPPLIEFQTATLEEIENIKLLNRYDTKYVFQIDELNDILHNLKDKYKILEINQNRIFNYENLYFDTIDSHLYNQHHNGKLNRFKIRYRHYKETEKFFLEIKQKTNKCKTIKERFLKSIIENRINGSTGKHIHELTNITPESLEPRLWVYYTRITLAHKTIPEKVTFDTNLIFKSNIQEKKLPGLVIAEVKQDRISEHSDFIQLMRNKKVKKMRLSKYCTGVVLTYPDVKYNKFKPKLLFINKLTNGHDGQLQFLEQPTI